MAKRKPFPETAFFHDNDVAWSDICKAAWMLGLVDIEEDTQAAWRGVRARLFEVGRTLGPLDKEEARNPRAGYRRFYRPLYSELKP